jgi:geranylgeranyl diphosphate synthase type I
MDNMPAEKQILEIHELKTAVYTVSGALQFGGILAGGKETPEGEARLRAMGAYGVPVGIAFQIQDDYLGTFSTEEKLGKSVTSDLAENKNTLLFLYTLQHGDAERRSVLQASLGNRDIGPEELSEAKKAIEGAGAVEYSRGRAARLVEEGKRHVEDVAANSRLRRLLTEAADFVIGRKN